ncbi:MAG: hypothetical protein HY023_09895 [Chloroflexi bacterium]|nr:hypothetical protein [Chloroflexota bacterium]
MINTDGVGKKRDQLCRAVVLAVRGLAAKGAVDDEARDMAAFIAIALGDIHETIDVTVAAWEKRDYWIKADQFRMQWGWSEKMSGQVRQAVLLNDWGELAVLLPEIGTRLGNVKLPKRKALGEPWNGALAELKRRKT